MIAVSGVVLRGIQAGLVVLCVAAAAAAGSPPVRSNVAKASAAGRATTRILGAAWNVDNNPIPQARLRLRNLTTGRVDATTVADNGGQFEFAEIEGGTYVIELVDASGKILTVGHPFIVAPGETVATFVRLGSKVPWFEGFFRDAAAATVATAAGAGITALAPVARPISAKR